MAIYNLNVGTRNFGALAKFNYNSREGKFSCGDKAEELLYKESFNIPKFAKDNPSCFWECADEFEGVGRNVYRKIEFSLPAELNDENNVKIAYDFAKKLLGEDYVYSLAIHTKQSNDKDINNIHCHLIFNERKLDGIERTKELFFKRANSKNPELGGTKKIDWSKKKQLYDIRELWEDVLNCELEKNNIDKVSSKRLVIQKEKAIEENNYIKADLLDREPIQLNSKLYRKKDNKKLNEEEKETIQTWQNNKTLKEIKENIYKIRVKEFEHYNEILEKLYIDEDPRRLENLETINELTEHIILVEDIETKIKKIKNNLDETVLGELAKQSFSNGEYKDVKKEFDELERIKKRVNNDLIFMSMSEFEKWNKAKEFLDNIEKNKFTTDRIKSIMRNKYLEMLVENEKTLKELLEMSLSKKDLTIFDERDRGFAKRIIFKELKDNLVNENIIKIKVDLKYKELDDEKILRVVIDEKHIVLVEENLQIKDKIFKLKLELKKEVYGDTPRRMELKNIIFELENKFVETENIINNYKENNKDFKNLKEFKHNEFKELKKEQADNLGRINFCYKKLKLLKENENNNTKIHMKDNIKNNTESKRYSKKSTNNFNKGYLRLRTKEDEERERD